MVGGSTDVTEGVAEAVQTEAALVEAAQTKAELVVIGGWRQ